MQRHKCNAKHLVENRIQTINIESLIKDFFLDSNCQNERVMSEAMEMCAMTASTVNFQFSFNLKKLMDEITTIDLEHIKNGLTNVLEVFGQVDKIVELETKTRKYVAELHEK